MIRRFAPVAGALACAAALSGLTACSTFTDNDVAASVDGSEISQDEFEQYLRSQDNVGTDVDRETAARHLTELVVGRLVREVLDDHGVELTPDDIDGYTSTLSTDDPFFSFSPTLQRDVIGLNVGFNALTRIPSLTDEQIADQYAHGPATMGLACYEMVTVDSRSEAEAIADQLRDGASLSDTGEDSTADVRGTNGACSVFTELWQGLEAHELTTALIDARPGEPAVVETGAGWAVVNVLPYDVVRESVTTATAAGIGEPLALGKFITGDISIDPAYGRWDPAVGQIVPA